MGAQRPVLLFLRQIIAFVFAQKTNLKHHD